VKTAISFKVDMVEDIMINDRVCQVRIQEENASTENNIINGGYFHDGSSSACSSTETWVSNTLQSVDSVHLNDVGICFGDQNAIPEDYGI